MREIGETNIKSLPAEELILRAYTTQEANHQMHGTHSTVCCYNYDWRTQKAGLQNTSPERRHGGNKQRGSRGHPLERVAHSPALNLPFRSEFKGPATDKTQGLESSLAAKERVPNLPSSKPERPLPGSAAVQPPVDRHADLSKTRARTPRLRSPWRHIPGDRFNCWRRRRRRQGRWHAREPQRVRRPHGRS